MLFYKLRQGFIEQEITVQLYQKSNNISCFISLEDTWVEKVFFVFKSWDSPLTYAV